MEANGEERFKMGTHKRVDVPELREHWVSPRMRFPENSVP